MSNARTGDYFLLINEDQADKDEDLLLDNNKAFLHRRLVKPSKNEGRRKFPQKATVPPSRNAKIFSGRVHKTSESDLIFSMQSQEREETVKCIISSALFVAVVITLILVAVLKNPEM